MKVAIWCACIVGAYFAAAYSLAVFTPATYLRIFSDVGVWPVSRSWVVDMARQQLESSPLQYCEDPFLLFWQGSFGEFDLIPDGYALPETHEYTKLVLGRTDIIREETKAALTAMLNFNSQLIARCF